MKLIVIAGTPGCGKTAAAKQLIRALKEHDPASKIGFIKFECLASDDAKRIGSECMVHSELHLAEDLCPDHYSALVLSRRLPLLSREFDYVVVETAGLCMRCSPYVTGNAIAVAVLDAAAGKIKGHGPILHEADIVLLTKSDLVSQAEREIMIYEIVQQNDRAAVVEMNGLTGEGIDLVLEAVENSKDFVFLEANLRGSMPSAICGYCYGSTSLVPKEVMKRSKEGKDVKSHLPNFNCGECGYKSCNEFIRKVLNGEETVKKCPFYKEEGW